MWRGVNSPPRLGRLVVLLLGGLIASVPAVGASRSDRQIEAIETGIAARRSAVLEDEVRKPFPSPDCKVPMAEDDPCDLGMLNFALAAFSLHRGPAEVAAANAQVRAALVRLPAAAGFKTQTVLRQGKPFVQEDTFHFERAQFLFRIVRMFGRSGTAAPGLLLAESETGVARLLWDWARTECRIADADAEHTWRIWGSENHGAQRDSACWAAATLAAEIPELADQHYVDGTTPRQQLLTWTVFLKAYLREHGRRGTLVEYFSPTYSQYTLLNFYLYYDFSKDDELRRLARATLDLWWAIWAQEQVDGIHGGSKTRAYPNTIADAAPMRGTAWLYFALGRPYLGGKVPGSAAMTVSSYHPPAVVTDIAVDTEGRGAYEVLSRAPGLALQPRTRDGWYDVDAEAEGILRVTYVAPGFVMGTAVLPRLPAKRWTEISSQNRWSGIVLAGDPEARIAVMAEAAGRGSNYNAFWSVQSKATQIVQALPAPYSANTGELRVWFGRPLRRVEHDGWVFVDGAAYVAVRPAFGGYRWDDVEPRWMRPTAGDAPVIIQAASRTDFADFVAFQQAVLAASLRINGGVLEFSGLNGAGRMIFDFTAGRMPEIDGAALNLPPDLVLRSPFVEIQRDTQDIRLKKGGRSKMVDFQAPVHKQ